jgi:hypothetical protein
MTKAIKKHITILSLFIFLKNGKNPHSRCRLLTLYLYKTNCCCWSFQSFRFCIESSCPKKNKSLWKTQ